MSTRSCATLSYGSSPEFKGKSALHVRLSFPSCRAAVYATCAEYNEDHPGVGPVCRTACRYSLATYAATNRSNALNIASNSRNQGRVKAWSNSPDALVGHVGLRSSGLVHCSAAGHPVVLSTAAHSLQTAVAEVSYTQELFDKTSLPLSQVPSTDTPLLLPAPCVLHPCSRLSSGQPPAAQHRQG